MNEKLSGFSTTIPHLGKHVILGLSLLAVLLLTSVATSEAALIETQPEAKAPNRLKFERLEDFQSYMEDLVESNDLNKVKRDYPGFITFSDSLNEIMASGGQTANASIQSQRTNKGTKAVLNPEQSLIAYGNLVEDPFLASVLNANGEIEIEGKVFKVTQSHVYSVDVKRANLLRAIDTLETSTVVMNMPKAISKFPIIRMGVSNTSDVTNNGVIVGNNTPTCTQEYKRNGHTYRLKGSSWNTSYWFYASAGSKTEHERRTRHSFLWFKWWGWDNVRTDHLSVSSQAGHSQFGYGLDNTSYVRVKSAWAIGWGVKINSFVAGTHNHFNGGVRQACNTFIPYKG